MKRLKCVGAILLALALIVGLLPVGVFHTHASATEAQNHGEVVQPSVDDGVTYIHAAYAANTITVDGALGLATTQTGTTEPAYRRQLSLPNGERFTVAWNLENLYVAATANITELKIAGVTVDLTAQEFQNEIQLFLDSLGINNLAAGYAFSIKVSGMTEAWTGTLVFDSSTYVTDAYTFGGGWGEYLVDGNPWKVQLDTYYNNETAEAANIRWRDIYNPSAIPGLYADFNASTVAEFDITIEHLKEITLTDGEIAFVEDYNFLTFGVSVTLNDDDASKTEAMQYGLYRLDNKLWFVCWDVDGFKSYEICNYADAENKTFHIRAELTYQPTAEVTDENKNEQNNIVAADFYVDGKLVAHSENAKRQFETLGQTASLGMFKVYTQGDHAITARTDVTLANVSANHKLPWLENFKQLTVSAGENYIHAAYADMDKDGETDANALRLNAPLSLYANARVGAAWDWENLYLSFTPDSGVTGVKVGGFEKAVTEDAVTIAWEDVLGHCLKANEISTEFAITITAEDAVLAGTLLLDTNDYHPEVQNTQTGDVTLDVVGTGPNAGPNQMLWGAGRLTPQAAVTIYDVDVDINSMNEGLVRELTGAGKVQSTYGLNFFLADSLAKAETAKATFFKFGLFRGSNDVVYLAYCNDTNYDEIVASGTETKDVITAVPVGIMGSGTFHIRVEYTYHDDDGNGYDLADRVSAVYYVNGKKVAEAESVRSVALMGSSVVGTAAGGVFVRPSIVCNVTVSNSSVSHANKNIVNDKAAADAVIAQIEEIGEVTLEDEAAIVAAEEAYGQLTEEQQKLVTNYDDLVAAKAAYAELKAAADKLAEDKAAADVVIAQIEEIGEVTLEDEAAIAAAEAAYANLTQDQKNLVTNYATLTAARVTYTELKAAADKLAEDKAAAKVVEDQIAAIGTVTYSKAAAIATVRNAYTALTDDQKALVANEATLTAAEAAIQELKAAIDAVEAKITAIGEVTLSKAEAIAQAKADFEALAADQQDAVENAAALTAAQAALKALQDDVADVIAMIDAIGTVTYSKAADIAAVRDAYDALNDEQKALVTNEATLTAAEAAIQELQAAIDAVEAKIDAIGEVTLSKAEAIAQAKADFEALAADQQDAVENAAALTAAQAALKALQDAVADVIAKIDAIGTVALNSKAAIETAEAAYAELNAEQQNLVTNYTTLTDARATYEELKEAADQAAIDQAAADGVKDLIDAIGTVDLDSEAAIKTAEEAYATLTPAQQDLVTNYGVLTAARTTYEELKAAAEQAAADKAAADAVIAQIGAIGTVTLDSEAAIESVEAAYEALTPAQKALVTNYNTLTTARTTYNELKAAAEQAAADKAAADEVIEKIEDIGTVSLDSIAAIEAAEAAYTALTPAQKALVTNYDDLTDARAEYDELKAAADQAAIDQAAANGMMELINNIGTVTLDSKTAIESAEAAYATLTDTQKALVTNYNILTAARAAYDQLKAAADQAAADAVIGKITAIGTVTLDSKEAIEAAEAAYASLTDAQKALVTNYATLTAARTAYDQLVAEKEAAEKEAADKAAADAAIAKINAIGTVTLESKLSIEAARVAYNALTEDQKALVSAEILLKLTNAETALKALETPDEPPKTGDTQMFVPAMLLLSLSVVGLAVVLTTKKKFF